MLIKTQSYLVKSFYLLPCAVLSHSVMSDSWGPTGFSVHADSPGKNTGVSCHALLQGIFSTQGSNPGLLHCRRILYHLSHPESPYLQPRDNLIVASSHQSNFKNSLVSSDQSTWDEKCSIGSLKEGN